MGSVKEDEYLDEETFAEDEVQSTFSNESSIKESHLSPSLRESPISPSVRLDSQMSATKPPYSNTQPSPKVRKSNRSDKQPKEPPVSTKGQCIYIQEACLVFLTALF
jgi:hypothetical protein